MFSFFDYLQIRMDSFRFKAEKIIASLTARFKIDFYFCRTNFRYWIFPLNYSIDVAFLWKFTLRQFQTF